MLAGRRLMRTRHIARLPYLIDCTRLAGLLSARWDRPTRTGQGEQLLLRGVSVDFLALLKPHCDLLNTFVRSAYMPSPLLTFHVVVHAFFSARLMARLRPFIHRRQREPGSC